MAMKIVLVALIAFVLCEIVLAYTSNRVARDAPAPTATTGDDDVSKTIKEMLNSFKSGVDDLLKNVQNNELVQNATIALQGFAKNVETQGKDLLNKIKTNTAAN